MIVRIYCLMEVILLIVLLLGVRAEHPDLRLDHVNAGCGLLIDSSASKTSRSHGRPKHPLNTLG